MSPKNLSKSVRNFWGDPADKQIQKITPFFGKDKQYTYGNKLSLARLTTQHDYVHQIK